MLCEMRGCDGNASGWNGSHGSFGSTRGICMFRKMEIGAYVVNSNQVSGYNSYCQGENDPDTVFTGYEPRHQGFPDSWRPELRASNTYASEHYRQGHQQRQAEQPTLRERHQLNLGSTSYRQISMIEKSSGSHPQWPNSSENCRTSMQTNRSTDGSVASNIYQGPIVRVQVPEAYYEGGSAKDSETAVGYRQNMSYNVDGEQMGQHLQRVKEVDEIYDGPVSAETYTRINEWLTNCQQHSSTSFKSSRVSYGPNHSRTENKLKQSTTSCNISKAGNGTCNQPSNISNLKLAKEPRVVAALQPKATTPGNVLQPNYQQKHQNTDRTKKHEVPFSQSSAVRNNNVTIAVSLNVIHVANITESYFVSDLSKTSSEWSSETLSIVGSDKSSYCTDFTPFELGYFETSGEKNRKDSMSTSASEYLTDIRKNFSVSHAITDDRMLTKNAAYTKNFSRTVHDSVSNEFVCNRRNDNSGLNSVWNTTFEPNSKQQQLQDPITDKIPKNLKSFEAPLKTSKTAHVVKVFIGDSERTLQTSPDFDNIVRPSIGMQNHCRYKKPTADPFSSAEAVQNLKIFDRRVYNEGRKSLQVPSEKKLYISERKPVIPVRCPSMEGPLSSQFTEKKQPFSTRLDNECYKESSDEKDSALFQKLESKQVPQMRSGSLSITIRPNRLSVMDYFRKIDDVWDSSGRKEETEMKETVEQLSDSELLQEISDNTAMDSKALEISDDVDDSYSGCSADVSDESEEQDEFTKTVIKADISERFSHLSSKTEFFSKPQYSARKQSKFLKTDASSLLADVHSRFAGKKVYQTPDDTQTDSEDQRNKDFERQSNSIDTMLNSGPSFLVGQRQLQESRSSLLPEILADSLDRCLQMKLPKNADRADIAFGYNSEYINCKHEDLDTNFRPRSEKKPSEMYSSPSESFSNIHCPQFLSNTENHSNSRIFRSDASITPIGSSGRMAPVSDGLYTYNRSYMDTVSPRSVPSEAASDVIYDHLGPQSVQHNGSKAKATNEESLEEDRFLMSLLQQRTPDIPEFGSFCTPLLQQQNLVGTSHFTVRSACVENSEQPPLISCTDELGNEIASKSMMRSPETFPINHLQEEEPSGLDLKPLLCGIYEFPKENGEEHCEDYHRRNSYETQCPGKMLKSSSDSPLSVFKESTAVPTAFPRCQSRNSDSFSHEDVGNKLQGRDYCSKMSKNYSNTSTIRTDTTKNIEAMSCQEFIDFPALVVDPPESFSDFTIVL